MASCRSLLKTYGSHKGLSFTCMEHESHTNQQPCQPTFRPSWEKNSSRHTHSRKSKIRAQNNAYKQGLVSFRTTWGSVRTKVMSLKMVASKVHVWNTI